MEQEEKARKEIKEKKDQKKIKRLQTQKIPVIETREDKNGNKVNSGRDELKETQQKLLKSKTHLHGKTNEKSRNLRINSTHILSDD